MKTPVTLSELRAAFEAGDYEAVLVALGELDFLEACCRGSVAAFIAELAYVVREAPRPLPTDVHLEHPSGARLDADVLALLAAILDANRAALTQAPDRLFSILYRELHWREQRLSCWAEHLRAAFEARPGACWLRPLRPPETLTLVSWRIRGEPRGLSADGRLLVLSRATGGQGCVVDARTCLTVLTIASPTSPGVSLSPDGACLAIFVEERAELWSTKNLAPYATLTAHDRAVQRAVFARDSSVVFTEAFKVVRAFRVADGVCLGSRTIDGESYIGGLLPSAAGSVLIHDGKRWLHWEYLEDRLRPIGDGDYVIAEWSAVSPSGDRLIAAEGTGAYSGWTLPDGVLLFRHKLPEQVALLAFHPSGAVFTGGQGFYDASTGEEIARLPDILVSKGRWPAFDPAGRFLVTRHEVPEAAQLWDVRDLALPILLGRFAIERYARGPLRAHFSADSHTLVFGDSNETVVVDLGASPPFPTHDEVPPVRLEWRARFSPAGTTAVFEHDGGLSFWDVPLGALRRFVAVDRSLGFFAGGRRVLVRKGDALAALDTEDGAEVWRLTQPGASQEETHAADEQGVLLYNERESNGVVLALDMRDGRVRYRLSKLMLLLHDRDVFLTRSRDGESALRDVTTGDVRVTLAALEGGTFAISPDHRWLAAYDDGIGLWDLTTGARSHVVDSTAYSFRFREDSAALITTSSQSPQSGNTDTITEEVFDVSTGACIGGSSWDEYGYGESGSSPPHEIAPGIVEDGSTLRVGEHVLTLPSGAFVGRTPAGEVFVAALSAGKRVDLYVLTVLSC